MTSHPKPVTIRPDVWSIPLAAVREPVDLEVIIPAFNESSRLPRTLAAMVTVLAAGSAARPGWTSRIVVVDNGSSDDTVAAAHILSLAGAEIVAIGCA
ncbi:MAG: glycosyltransferase, partial [Pseudonocardia sp.]|nr:glycosyltransferase [Pseudonocardia sp.]